MHVERIPCTPVLLASRGIRGRILFASSQGNYHPAGSNCFQLKALLQSLVLIPLWPSALTEDLPAKSPGHVFMPLTPERSFHCEVETSQQSGENMGMPPHIFRDLGEVQDSKRFSHRTQHLPRVLGHSSFSASLWQRRLSFVPWPVCHEVSVFFSITTKSLWSSLGWITLVQTFPITDIQY